MAVLNQQLEIELSNIFKGRAEMYTKFMEFYTPQQLNDTYEIDKMKLLELITSINKKHGYFLKRNKKEKEVLNEEEEEAFKMRSLYLVMARVKGIDPGYLKRTVTPGECIIV